MHNQRAIRGQGASLGKTIRNISNIPGYPSQWLLFLLDKKKKKKKEEAVFILEALFSVMSELRV